MRLIPLYIHKYNPEMHYIIGNYGNKQIIRYSRRTNRITPLAYGDKIDLTFFIPATEYNLRLTNSVVFYNEG